MLSALGVGCTATLWLDVCCDTGVAEPRCRARCRQLGLAAIRRHLDPPRLTTQPISVFCGRAVAGALHFRGHTKYKSFESYIYVYWAECGGTPGNRRPKRGEAGVSPKSIYVSIKRYYVAASENVLFSWTTFVLSFRGKICWLLIPRAAAVVRLTRSLLDTELFPHTAYVKIFATLARKTVNWGCQQKATH